MGKYYRVLKDTPLWLEGAIIKFNVDLGNYGGYEVIEDIWNPCEHQDYVSKEIIEAPANSGFFERVYKSSPEKLAFKTAEEMKKLFNSFKK